jgi:outer membrane protein OmpA-like peptidoglycan-associated protein
VALDEARFAIDAARANPQVATYAGAELDDAVVLYQKAETAFRAEGDTAEVRQLGHLARQRAVVAQEAAARRQAEQAVAEVAAERERLRLAARTAEAEAAARAAEVAELRAQSARQAALDAERQAMAAQRQAELSQRSAQSAQDQARAAELRSSLLERELRELAATRSDRGLVVTLNDVLFDTGSATLRPGGQRLVSRMAAFLREYPERTIAIEGFTDSVGSESMNQVLSERRAAAVRQALIDAGIDGSRIAVRGYGPSFPVATNETAEGRQRNRRVEVVISDATGTIGPRVVTYVVPAR